MELIRDENKQFFNLNYKLLGFTNKIFLAPSLITYGIINQMDYR
jgi:hypothetical protein